MLATKMIDNLREFQKEITDEQRIKLWNKIQKGYCHECGTDYLPCYCLNEE